ncbi:hypothetical protein D3C71_2126930 [compost metagenome]
MAAGAFEGLGPAVVEDIFAHGMGFEEQRQEADGGAGFVLHEDVLRLPAGAAIGAA